MFGVAEISLYALLMSVFSFPIPPMPLAGKALAYGGVTAALYARSQAPATATGEALGVMRLESRDDGSVEAVALFCRLGDRWFVEAACATVFAPGQRLVVVDGRRGRLGHWQLAEALEGGSVACHAGRYEGEETLSAPDEDPLRTPLALLTSASSPLAPIQPGGLAPDELSAVLEGSRRPLRIAPAMSAGLEASQQLLAPMLPDRPPALVLAASNYPEGALDAAPIPSTSLVFARIAGGARDGGDWIEHAASQVISKGHDLRKFERFAVIAVLDLDGDGRSELLVRGRSVLGDRFRLFHLDERERLRPASPWAGVVQPSSAPRQ